MDKDNFILPDQKVIRRHVINAMRTYWPKNSELIDDIPSPFSTKKNIILPLKLVEIKLPSWGEKWGVNGSLLVPVEALISEKHNDWKNVDWFLAAFLLLEAWHERVWELANGSIHSYSFKLKDWDTRAWDYAFVNRIALFLREWVAYKLNSNPLALFGDIPKSNILMTHDVDAVKKTSAIRLKQSLFNIINGLIYLPKAGIIESSRYFYKAIRFFFSTENWWKFDTLSILLNKYKIKSIFHFHTDHRTKNPLRWLFDPNYDVTHGKTKHLIEELLKDGHTIGLHPGFDSYNNEYLMSTQKKRLENSTNVKLNYCRQHWLRFSFSETWSTQERVGFMIDTTLMFNNRPGFRNSCAIKWNPWCNSIRDTHLISAIPSILMDSHLYDYKRFNQSERIMEIEKWINECQFVGGTAAVLWHPHTLTNDYDWTDGFIELLKKIKN